MATIRLERSPQRADLKGFAVATALLWCVLAASVTVWTGIVWPVVIAALTSAMSVAIGLWRPEHFLLPYRVFNKLASMVSRLTAAAVRLVCFYLVIGGAGLVRSRLQQGKPDGPTSGWQPRGPLEITSLWQSPTRRRPNGWVRNYASWATTGANLWVWCLLPFLLILSTVELEDEGVTSTGNYTLY
ncbi:MAG: hypothetical protein ACRD1Q_11055 [Vicinamibacterales bacterium]